MIDKVFLDTNIVLYALDKSSVKQQISINLLQSNPIISTQVLNEFSNICVKKLKLDIEQITDLVGVLSSDLEVKLFDANTILKALSLKEKYNFQYYDSLIIATALENDCKILYTEDMQDSLIVEHKLTIINPFKKVRSRNYA